MEVIKKTNLITGEVTSFKLAKGARKPIILTPSTTEVDEETYQKLISADVDVMFRTDDGNYCILTYKSDNGDAWNFYFTCFSFEGDTIDITYIYAYIVDITKNSPHTCHITENISTDLQSFINGSGYLDKPTISIVLQEIDLTGTDVERKTKLTQFEADWKNLTGASDLTGARFVVNAIVDSNEITGVLTYNMPNDSYSGICRSENAKNFIIDVSLDGSLIITPLFIHLEPVEIIPDNFAASKQKNLDNLNAYKSNLEVLGVDISNGYSVPVRITGNTQEYHGMLNIGTGALLSGIVTDVNETHHYPFNVNTTDGAITFDANNYFLEKTSNEVTEMLDAIKYSYTPVLLTATTSTNKTQLDLFLSKVPNAQVMHVTYKDMYAGTLHKINGSWYGVLVGESNTLAGQLSIKLQADGTIVEGTA